MPAHFSYRPYLVTAENVAQVAAASLGLLAEIPSRLVGVNRQAEQSRMKQLETSAAINRHVGALLDRRQQGEELAKLVQTDYGYDCVHILRWSPSDGMLYPEHSTAWPAGLTGLRIEEEALLSEALRTGKPVFVSDMQQLRRFPADERWPRTRSRVVIPIRLGDQTLGVLDLHSWHPRGHLQQEMIGLQALADHLAIAMRNADLYAEALRARGPRKTQTNSRRACWRTSATNCARRLMSSSAIAGSPWTILTPMANPCRLASSRTWAASTGAVNI